MKIKGVEKLVQEILMEKPETRSDDDLLYYEACCKSEPAVANLTFSTFVRARKVFKVPPFESVSRSHRKLQSIYPELAADKDVEARRELAEEEFKEWSHVY